MIFRKKSKDPEAARPDYADEGPIPQMPLEDLYRKREDLGKGVKEALDDLEDDVLKRAETMTPEEMAEAANTMREGEIEYLERQTGSDDPETAARAEFILDIKEEIDGLIDEVNKDIRKGDHDLAERKIKRFLEGTREKLEPLPLHGDDVEMALAQMQLLVELDLSLLGAEEETKSALLTLLSLGIDLVPLVGGVKMMAEGAAGNTLAGDKLHGLERLVHMGEGMFWEVVDVVAILAAVVTAPEAGAGGVLVEGVAATAKGAKAASTAGRGAKAAATVGRGAKAAKNAPRVSKTLTRTGAFMRKHGVEGSKEVFRAGQFMLENPKAEKLLQKGFEKGWEKRTVRHVAAKEALKPQAEKVVQSHKDQVQLLKELNDERERLTRVLGDIYTQAQGVGKAD